MHRFIKHWHIIALIVITVVAAALRLYKLGSIPGSLYIDEVAIGVDAKSILETGKDMHGGSWLTTTFPSYGDFKLPVYIWLTAGSIKLFGATDFAVRFPSALAGIFSVVLVYGIMMQLFHKDTKRSIYALSAAFMVALLPWSIQFSRTGFEAHIGQFFLLCAVWFALKGRTKTWLYIFSALFGAIAVYTYYSVRFVFPPLFFAIVLLSFSNITRVKSLKVFGIAVGAIFLFLLTMYPMSKSPWYAAMQHIRLSTKHVLDVPLNVEQSNALRATSNNDLLSRAFYHRYVLMGKNLFEHYLDHIHPQFVFISGDKNLRHNTGEVGLLLFWMMPAFFVGLFTVWKRYPKIGLMLLVWFIFGILPAAVPYNTPHALRSLNVLGVYAVLLGVGFGEMITQTGLQRRALVLLVSIAMCFNFISYWHDYRTHYPDRSEGKWWAMSKKVVAQFVRDNKDEYREIEIAANDKMFLWIAWYADIPVEIIQKSPEESFIKLSLQNVLFKTTLKVDKNKKNILYISEASQLQDDPQSEILTGDASEPFRYVETQ